MNKKKITKQHIKKWAVEKICMWMSENIIQKCGVKKKLENVQQQQHGLAPWYNTIVSSLVS